MLWSWPLRARGALRNHSSLNAATVTALNSPDGAVTGTEARTSGSKRRAPSRRDGGRSSRRAWSARSRTARPMREPRARQSIHATE